MKVLDFFRNCGRRNVRTRIAAEFLALLDLGHEANASGKPGQNICAVVPIS